MPVITPLDLQQADTRRLVELAGLLSDDLTATPLERELVRRLEEEFAEQESEERAGDRELLDVAHDWSIDAEDLGTLARALISGTDNTAKILNVVAEAGIDSADELKAQLDIADRIRQIVIDDDQAGLTQLLQTLAEE